VVELFGEQPELLDLLDGGEALVGLLDLLWINSATSGFSDRSR
jgi:hypothetical protein